MSKIAILGAHHASNLGDYIVENDQPRMVRIQVLLADHTDTYGHPERRLAAYEPDDQGRPVRRLGYVPKGAPRQAGDYLATLHRPDGKRRLEGRLQPLGVGRPLASDLHQHLGDTGAHDRALVALSGQ